MLNYRPLPECISIKKSPIDGMGLFANTSLDIGINLGITHLKVYLGGLFPQNYCRTPLGGFYNHSDTPNCELVKRLVVGHTEVLELWTIERIGQGEEITCSYTLYQIKTHN